MMIHQLIYVVYVPLLASHLPPHHMRYLSGVLCHYAPVITDPCGVQGTHYFYCCHPPLCQEAPEHQMTSNFLLLPNRLLDI